MPCHAGTGSSLCGRGGLLYSKHILCEMENSMALLRWKGIAHPRTWEPRHAFTGRRRTGSAFPTPLREAARSLLQPLPRSRRSLVVGLDPAPALAPGPEQRCPDAVAEGLCRAASRAGSRARHFLQAAVAFPFSGAARSFPCAEQVRRAREGDFCLSFLTERIPLGHPRERFSGLEPFSINKRLQELPPAACRASSSCGQPGRGVPATSPL